MSTIDSKLVDLPPGSRRRRGSDYAELLTRVRLAGMLDLRPAYYAVKIAVNALLVVAGWTVFVLLGDSSLRHARPIVRAYCLEHGLPYVETGLLDSYRRALRHLHTVGPGDRPVRQDEPAAVPDARLVVADGRRAHQRKQ